MPSELDFWNNVIKTKENPAEWLMGIAFYKAAPHIADRLLRQLEHNVPDLLLYALAMSDQAIAALRNGLESVDTEGGNGRSS